MRPLIGLTGEGEPSLPMGWTGARDAYFQAIWQAGGLPLLLSPDEALAKDAALALDGLLLTGGWDIDPVLFGETAHPMTDGVSKRRDCAEIALIREFFSARKPILGICRGIQIIAAAFGGSLIQHLPDHPGVLINHSARVVRHPVRISPGSILRSIYAQEEIYVNSTHHQAVGRLPEGFTATAFSPDNVVEAVEREGILAVQWHPERLIDEGQLCLFRYFIGQCKSIAERK